MTAVVAEFVPKPCEPSARSSSDIEMQVKAGRSGKGTRGYTGGDGYEWPQASGRLGVDETFANCRRINRRSKGDRASDALLPKLSAPLLNHKYTSSVPFSIYLTVKKPDNGSVTAQEEFHGSG